MSKSRGYRNKSGRPKVGDKAKETLENLDENDPVIIMFREYSQQLDNKQDKYERIVKLGRDITIESKRIIFLLHNTNTDIEAKRSTVIAEAELRLQNLINNNFKSIALELKNEDNYQYHKAYTNGLQEFVEALLFTHYIKNESIGNWSTIDNMFKYNDEENGEFQLLIPQYDFILGIGDFTGELMRRCINTLGIGNIDDCFKLCNFVRHINTGFLGIFHGNKEISRKAYVLRQSLAKMELVCYNIQIRGSEIPKHMLMSVIESSEAPADEDEGYY